MKKVMGNDILLADRMCSTNLKNFLSSQVCDGWHHDLYADKNRTANPILHTV